MSNDSCLHSSTSWPADWFCDEDTCLFCGSQKLARYIDGVEDWYFRAVPGSFSYSRCADCGSLVLDRRPNPDHIAEAYVDYYTHTQGVTDSRTTGVMRRIWGLLTSAYARTRFGARASWRDHLLSLPISVLRERGRSLAVHYRFLPNQPSRVLDYGCGNGDFLARAAHLGHQVTGIEFDPAAAELTRSRGIATWTIDELDKDAMAEQFDHLTANHVIEHVTDPTDLLVTFASWLRPGGTLFLEVPNARAEGIARHGSFWRGLEAPRHFALPTFEALQSALTAAGFTRIERIVRREVRENMDEIAVRMASQVETGHTALHLDPGKGEEEFLTVLARLADDRGNP